MNSHQQLIHQFYTAFQQLDAPAMIACYHEEAHFRDPVFELTSKEEIRAMWTMLCENAGEFELYFEEVSADERIGSAQWKAEYLFSQTNRKVVNRIHAAFVFRDGLIVEHVDSFNFWKWSRQALGAPGYALGWTHMLQKKVQKEAHKSLSVFRRSRSV